MFNQLHDLPTVQRALAVTNSTIALSQRIHATATSDRAHRVYAGIIKVTVDAMLLTIAAGMLTRQAFETLHSLYKTHKDKDFAKLATEQFEAVAVTVKRFVRGRRDRAFDLYQETATKLERQARDKVGDLLLTLGDKVLPQCPNGICPVNLDEV